MSSFSRRRDLIFDEEGLRAVDMLKSQLRISSGVDGDLDQGSDAFAALKHTNIARFSKSKKLPIPVSF